MPSSRWKTVAKIVLWPVMPAWPDEGRRFVQGPVLRRMLEQTFTNSPARRVVLNAGAGEGLFSPLLLAIPRVARAVEIDLSYSKSRRRASDPRQFLAAASLTGTPFASGAFDTILCSEVLEHIDDDGAALDELRRVLAPGGWLLISVPTPPAPFDPNHVREGYRSEDLAAMLSQRGLKVVATDFCMHGAFKLILRLYRFFGTLPKTALWALAIADRTIPIGTPMDLVMLAQLPES